MTQVMNFRRMEVMGENREAALKQAPFNIMGDATQAYKNWRQKQVNGVTDVDKKQFMLDYLAKKSKNTPGAGFFITIEPAVDVTRERPYTYKDVVNDKGTRVYKTVYQIVDKETGAIIAEVAGTKAKAKEVAKALYQQKGFKGNIKCLYTKQVTEGEPVAFEMTYTPSKSARIGTYLVFGIEKD